MLKYIVPCPLFHSKRSQRYFLLIISVILALSMLVGCGPSPEDLKSCKSSGEMGHIEDIR